MIKVITSDADGILTDLENYQHWMVKDYFTKKGEKVPEIKNPDAYDIADIYEITKRRRQIIWLQYFKHYCLTCQPRENAFEVLKEWQSMGSKIGIVTARAFATNKLVGPMARKWYEEWQAMFDFVPNEIAYCPEKGSGTAKAIVCAELNSQLMIEDKIDNFEPLLDVCDVIGINASYNQGYEPVNKPYNIYMTNNWDEVKETYDKIETIKRGFNNV